MNGLTNSILSVLLSWIRMLITNLWSVITSDGGGEMFQFLSAHWLTLLAALCITGFVVDRIIYFIRWRPHYVWLSRLERLRSRREAVPDPFEEPPAPVPEPAVSYSPQMVRSAQATRVYAPIQASEPLFDEEVPVWEAQETPQERQPRPNPNYYRDMAAGYAPPVPPQQLYAAPEPQRPQQPYAAPEPVHPGLNGDIFRTQTAGNEPAPNGQSPGFRPFTYARPDDEAAARSRTRLARFARSARNLVGMDDEKAPTIHDLQSTVDVSQAFHDPVYPQPDGRDRANR